MKAKIFIGSSLEAISVAKRVGKHFRKRYEVVPWNKKMFKRSKAKVFKRSKVFKPSQSFLDSLLKTANECNFGVFVFRPSDLLKIRKKSQLAVRDNVVFECGMFFGKLGRGRAFFLVPSDVKNLRLPTDLAGVVPAYYRGRRGKALKAGITEACSAIEEKIREKLHGSQRTSLNGWWEETWVVPGAGRFHGKNRTLAEVLHIGNQFLAVCHDKHMPFSVKGRVEWPFITGTWASVREGAYFGAFQLQIHRAGDEMEGAMVGFDSDNNIPAGTWTWKRRGAVTRTKRSKGGALKKDRKMMETTRRSSTARLIASISPRKIHSKG